MKTSKQLLQLILDNINLLSYGLCNLIFRLWQKDKITTEEKWFILDYLNNNRPKRIKSDNVYWWFEGWKLPRILWLRKQIRKLK